MSNAEAVASKSFEEETVYADDSFAAPETTPDEAYSSEQEEAEPEASAGPEAESARPEAAQAEDSYDADYEPLDAEASEAAAPAEEPLDAQNSNLPPANEPDHTLLEGDVSTLDSVAGTPEAQASEVFSGAQEATQGETSPHALAMQMDPMQTTLSGTPPAATPAGSKPATPRAATPVEDKPATPPAATPAGSKLATPRAATPVEGKPATPPAATPAGSKPATPRAATPVEGKPATPPAATPAGSKPATPRAVTPVEGKPATPPAATPAGSKPATPRTATPVEGKPATPPAATPAGSKPATPRAATPVDAKPPAASDSAAIESAPTPDASVVIVPAAPAPAAQPSAPAPAQMPSEDSLIGPPVIVKKSGKGGSPGPVAQLTASTSPPRMRSHDPWLTGTFKTAKGRIISGEELCQSLEKMTHAYVDKYMAGEQGGARSPPVYGPGVHGPPHKTLTPEDLDSMISRLYQTKNREEAAAEANKLERVQLRFDEQGREHWVPVKKVSVDDQKEYMVSLYSRCLESRKKTEEALAAKWLQPLGKPRK